MSRQVLILRPEPGATETARRALALGLQPVAVPLFVVRPLEWQVPDPRDFEAVLLTSANGARFGGNAFLHLPCYTAGEASAAAARLAGYGDIRIGGSDGAAAAALMAADGIRRGLHLCGRDHIQLAAPGLELERRAVYAAEALERLPEAAEAALAQGTTILLHSARAAGLLASLVGARQHLKIAAISAPVAAAAGDGWAEKWVASHPRDEALLELAAELCQTG